MRIPIAGSTMRVLLMCLLLQCLHAGAQQARTADSLRALLVKSHTDTAKCNVLQQLAAYYINKPGAEQEDVRYATGYATQALVLGKQIAYADGQAGSLALLAQISRENGDTAKARQYVDKALVFASSASPWPAMAKVYEEKAFQFDVVDQQQVKPKAHYYGLYVEQLRLHGQRDLKLADALKYYGDVLRANEEFAKSLHCLKQSLALYQDLHYTQLQDVYCLLGGVLYNLDDLQEAIKYLLLAKKLAEEAHDTSAVMYNIYNRLGITYEAVERFPEAGTYEEKAYQVAERLHDREAMSFFAANLADTYTELHQYDKAQQVITKGIALTPSNRPGILNMLQRRQFSLYIERKDYTAALRYFPIVKPMMENQQVWTSLQHRITSKTVQMFLATRNYTQAEKYIRKMEAYTTTNLAMLVRKTIEKHRFTLDSMQGNYIAAMRHYQRYMLYSDSMAMVKHDRQLAHLKVEYETEQKDRDLELKEKHISLLTMETDEQKELIQHEATKRNLSYVIGALLLSLLLISAWAYNIKRRANLQLKQQQFEINQRNITLKQLLDERDWLLKEVHHRVKNNLQIVISLLNSQALHLHNETARQALRESKNRMQAISLIHQKLYKSDSFSGVNMNYYVSELMDFLQDSFSIRDLVTVEMELDYADLDVSQAVPIGLIINEAVTNAIKYAVPHTVQPRIRIQLHSDDEQVALSISDNGAGFPPGFDPQASDSFGLSLIIGLVRQLRGNVTFNSDAGLQIDMTFPPSRILV
ncbi:histidine kinase dimerization/phosphoacceptor domain -containing protein [Chitinophaga sp. CF418]|uniref:histidine kinase dimerization/phosphoacceptor domain -containing protein n=1 Tax=Chitinophaga sp. CF418 TaxID=1855287 RepID=UPI000916EC91|nr:histidine kinase dimerization/phosphoacceptor domain -containing protein [Chitinophaga sp. CF418]SHL93883.1 Two-component sensor histidine kinase, contains HisKA and HATPase domains [Chitinophaga sp. CF418]